MRVESRGQVTISQEVGGRHDFLPDTVENFVERDGMVVVPSRS